ncbi:hypothetical protein M885DRAFT_585775 [Pelagophyceae sp. CCMP2097]|nr:hypothetical protein M885DRAFT_585775 [Pelagophyceae sp. CCMP2097]
MSPSMAGRALQSAQAFSVPVEGAAGVLYGLLIAFSVVTLVELFRKKAPVKYLLRPDDGYFSHRGQSKWPTLALSYFASGMGAWIVYGTTELGATRAVSWWGVIGYSSGSAEVCTSEVYTFSNVQVPAVLLIFLGPLVKRRVDADEKLQLGGFSATDFALKRYGRVMHLHVCCISCFFMYIYMVAELTTIGNVYALLVGKSTKEDDSAGYTTMVTVSVAAFTWFYTAVAGLPASILTDKVQGAVIAVLVVMLLFSCVTLKSNQVSEKEFDKSTGWFSKGFEALVSLWIAIASAGLFNQGHWQRVWAAASDRDIRIGFSLGALMTFFVMMFFGIMGMIAFTNDREAYESYDKLAYLSFFDLLQPLPQFWHYITLALLTMLAASSLDTVQNGISSVLSADLLNHKLSPNWSRLIVVGFNVAAVIQAADRFEVVPLFLVADLVCSTVVGPLFAGLMTQDLKWGPFYIAAPTEVGAFLGACSGIAAVLVNGKINGVRTATNPRTGDVYQRGPFAYFWLKNTKADGSSYDCALCGAKTMTTFIIVPLVAFFATFVFSTIDVYIGGEAARQPFLKIPRLDSVIDEAVKAVPIDALSIEDNSELRQRNKESAPLE